MLTSLVSLLEQRGKYKVSLTVQVKADILNHERAPVTLPF